MELLKQLKSHVRPNVVTYNAVIDVCCKCSELPRAMAMLASMEVPTYTLPPNDEAARKVFEEALMVAKSGSRPVCLLAPPKTFSGAKAVAPI